MTAPASMSTNDKVLTMLAEYSSLRSEIQQRNSVFNQYCVIAMPATVAASSLVYTTFPPAAFILFAVICCVLYSVFRLIEFDTLAAATRLREIEAIMNDMAGERVLVWETDNGLNTVGYHDRLAYIVGPLLRYVRALTKGRAPADAVRVKPTLD